MPATVILGAGIIGVSTAYYLSFSLTPSSIHLIEPSPELFSSASGFAGGFLAADWFSASVSELGRLSFEEHARIAREFGGAERWGYRRSTGLSYSVGRKGREKSGEDWLREGTSRADVAGDGASSKADRAPGWLARKEGDVVEVISEKGSTAQVEPRLLCQFLLKSCLDRGVQLHQPYRAVSIGKDEHGQLATLSVLDTETNIESDIPCARILIAAGAWSTQVFSTLFPNSKRKLPLSSLAGYSLVVRCTNWGNENEADCHAIFTTEASYSPEIFSRANGEIYIAGMNFSTLPLPNLPGESEIDADAIRALQSSAERLLVAEKDGDLETVRKGLCFRPVTERGTPILGRIPDQDLGGIKTKGASEGGVWLAAGHGPWGISMSLGTGKVMAEMIQGEPTSASVSRLGL